MVVLNCAVSLQTRRVCRVPTLAVNLDGLKRLCKRAIIEDDQELARRIGVDGATVYRVLKGKNAPSARFIAGALQTFGHSWFNELFRIVEDK
jgi:transcriptional regulator with XRE-family HTH domain